MTHATITLAAPKRPAQKQLSKATGILPAAQRAALSAKASPAPAVAATPPPAARKKTARKPPPWYKILIANAVLFAIVYGAYCLWHCGGDETVPSTQSAAVQPPADSKPEHSTPKTSGTGRPVREIAAGPKSSATSSKHGEPVKPSEDGSPNATTAPAAPTHVPDSGWVVDPGIGLGPRKIPEEKAPATSAKQQEEEKSREPNAAGPDMDPPEEPPERHNVQPPARDGGNLADETPVTPANNPPPQVLLTGNWQTANGGLFDIQDNGRALTIKFIGNPANFLAVNGNLSRGKNPNELEGTLDGFLAFNRRQYPIHTRVSVVNKDLLKFKYKDFPYVNPRTGKVTFHARDEDWTRVR